MIPSHFHAPPAPPQPPPLVQPLRPPVPPSLLNLLSFSPSPQNPLCDRGSFWRFLESLRENLNLLKSVRKELELIALWKEIGDCVGDSGYDDITQFREEICRKRVNLSVQEELSIEAAKSLSAAVKKQLDELSVIIGENGPWEKKSEIVRLVQRLQKYNRNKKWRKQKRRKVAETLRKEHEMFDKVDKEADDWRAREIAKDTAKHKMEEMKEIAKLKANEERNKLESELELVLVVEKLQELRAIRIQKMKKQGHFLPEEDDKFLERVRAAVEEEERQAAAAADTGAAKDAIASAEVSRKTTKSIGVAMIADKKNGSEGKTCYMSGDIHGEHISPSIQVDPEIKCEAQVPSSNYEAISNLPLEFYHYYHGSNYDMGTLIEVRRTWDAYIRPGGSRIPGHWIRPPPPADEVWASYLLSSSEQNDQSRQ